jgi:uncharacterized protein (DUF302 family)
MEQTTRYGFSIPMNLGYQEALAETRKQLGLEGFGILTEIDVAVTLKQKLGVDFRPYAILGACNPPLAHRALLAELDIGLLLPCNLVVYAGDEPGTSVVGAMDPLEALALTENEEIRPVAVEVRHRLERVLAGIAAAGGAAR